MKILLAVDGSAHSDGALKCLGRLLVRARHSITVAHVVRPVGGKGGGKVAMLESLEAGGRKLLDLAASQLGVHTSSSVESVGVVSDDPAGTILKTAKRVGADLIVLGARGLTPFKAFLLGSVSQRVARHAGCAVLIVRRFSDDWPLRAALAVDGSPSSRRASAFFKRLGLSRETDLTVLHAVELPSLFIPADYGASIADPVLVGDLLKDEISRGRRLLENRRADLSKEFKNVRAKLLEGPAAGEILRWLEENPADLTVLGQRGLSAVERFLMGSVSHQVAAHAAGSVLLVP